MAPGAKRDYGPRPGRSRGSPERTENSSAPEHVLLHNCRNRNPGVPRQGIVWRALTGDGRLMITLTGVPANLFARAEAREELQRRC